MFLVTKRRLKVKAAHASYYGYEARGKKNSERMIQMECRCGAESQVNTPKSFITAASATSITSSTKNVSKIAFFLLSLHLNTATRIKTEQFNFKVLRSCLCKYASENNLCPVKPKLHKDRSANGRMSDIFHILASNTTEIQFTITFKDNLKF